MPYKIEVPLADVSTTDVEISQVTEAVSQGRISGTGPEVRRFEELLAAQVGRNHVIATNSGTMALVILLQALGIGHGDKVLVSSFTFVAPAAACRLVGATAVLVDINKESWTLDPERCESLINLYGDAVKAIIAVDLMGHPADYDKLYRLAVKHELFLIEDAAQAHGSEYYSQNSLLQSNCGSFGHGSIFSFHANKTISCGEGGAILVDDYALAEECRLISNHGMKPSTPYYHTRVGRNGKLGNLQAAFGIGQMFRWESLIQKKIDTIETYCRHLSGLPGLLPRPITNQYSVKVIPWMMTLFVRPEEAGLDSNQLVSELRDRGIDARTTWPPLNLSPQGEFYLRASSPVSEEISANTLWLPTHQAMEEEVIEFVCQQIKEILDGARREEKTS